MVGVVGLGRLGGDEPLLSVWPRQRRASNPSLTSTVVRFGRSDGRNDDQGEATSNQMMDGRVGVE